MHFQKLPLIDSVSKHKTFSRYCAQRCHSHYNGKHRHKGNGSSGRPYHSFRTPGISIPSELAAVQALALASRA